MISNYACGVFLLIIIFFLRVTSLSKNHGKNKMVFALWRKYRIFWSGGGKVTEVYFKSYQFQQFNMKLDIYSYRKNSLAGSFLTKERYLGLRHIYYNQEYF